MGPEVEVQLGVLAPPVVEATEYETEKARAEEW